MVSLFHRRFPLPKHTSITLGDHFNAFIAEEVASGRFGTASEVVRAGLRLLEREEKKLAALRAAVDEGDASPESEDVDGEEFFEELMSGLNPKNE
jgi:antitoxin ParD1/3/4